MDNIENNIHEIILIFKHVFSHNSMITNKLNNNLEENILEKTKMLSPKLLSQLNDLIYNLLIIINCIDFNKLSKNIRPINRDINSYNLFVQSILSLPANYGMEKQFLLNFGDQIQILFACFDLLMMNPKKYIEKLNTYKFNY